MTTKWSSLARAGFASGLGLASAAPASFGGPPSPAGLPPSRPASLATASTAAPIEESTAPGPAESGLARSGLPRSVAASGRAAGPVGAGGGAGQREARGGQAGPEEEVTEVPARAPEADQRGGAEAGGRAQRRARQARMNGIALPSRTQRQRERRQAHGQGE